MLIFGEDISNDVTSIFYVFSMFVYIRARLRCALIGGNLTAQSAGNHRGIGGVIQIPEKQWQAVIPFPSPLPERSRRACTQAILISVLPISSE